MAVPRITRELYFKFSALILVFLLLVFDRDMANIYILILMTDFIWYRLDNYITFQIERTTDNRFSSLIQVGIATIAFFLISRFALQAIGEPGTGMQATLELLATSTPILAGNTFLTFVGWALLIPIIESIFFFGTLLEGLAYHAETRVGKKIDMYRFSFASIMVVLVVAASFALFHITAKNLQSSPLILTFIFAIISCILVIRNKEIKQAILFHMLVNGMAVANQFGIL